MWDYFLYPNNEKLPKRVETPTYFLYPNSEKMPKKVEIPVAGRPHFSTQTAYISHIGRDFLGCGIIFSTQMAENQRKD